MREMAKEDGEKVVQSQTEAGPSIPAPDSSTEKPDTSNAIEADPAGAAPAESPLKGKERVESTTPAAKNQEDDDLAIGPTDPVSHESNPTPEHPVCNITLLLPSGARHPYKLDEKYLTKRNVDVPGFTDAGKKDPFSISVYTLKELILREWRDEWDNKPASPSSIRLIHFGKLLEDKEQLKSKFCFVTFVHWPGVIHANTRPSILFPSLDSLGLTADSNPSRVPLQRGEP